TLRTRAPDSRRLQLIQIWPQFLETRSHLLLYNCSMNAGVCPIIPLTISEALQRHAERDAAAAAILCPGLAPLTFGALHDQVRRISAQLQAAGIGPWSRVGVALPRGPEAALISVAVCSTAVVLPLNPN